MGWSMGLHDDSDRDEPPDTVAARSARLHA
jgi:hypothetical protein